MPITYSNHIKNFNLLRLLAASFVIIGHSPSVLWNKNLEFDPFMKLIGFEISYFGVILFFAISGFLITQSWYSNKNWNTFLLARIARILPALIGVSFFSVFILGPIFTQIPLIDYFSNLQTYKYLLNSSIYRLYYFLPAVFKENPSGMSINSVLWTIPYEFTCYLFVLILGKINFLNKWFILILFTILQIAYFFFQHITNQIVIPILAIDLQNFIPYFLYFISGMLFYLFKGLIKFNYIYFLTAFFIIILINFEFLPDFIKIYPITYIIFYIVFSKYQFDPFEKTGDFSYGLYLYAFPIQQSLVSLFPNLKLIEFIILSFLCTIPFAIFSWQLIEKPCLKLHKSLKLKFIS